MVVSAPYSSTLVAPSLESYSLTEGRAVVVDPACCFLAVYLSCPFSGLRESLAAPISSPSLLELIVRNVPAPH